MNEIHEAAPHCPDDDIVMQESRGIWRCPKCGHLQLHDEAAPPAEFGDSGLRIV